MCPRSTCFFVLLARSHTTTVVSALADTTDAVHFFSTVLSPTEDEAATEPLCPPPAYQEHSTSTTVRVEVIMSSITLASCALFLAKCAFDCCFICCPFWSPDSNRSIDTTRDHTFTLWQQRKKCKNWWGLFKTMRLCAYNLLLTAWRISKISTYTDPVNGDKCSDCASSSLPA